MPLSNFSRTLLRQLILNRQSELDRMASTATNESERSMIATDRQELSMLWDEGCAAVTPSTASSNTEAQDSEDDVEVTVAPPRRGRGRPPKARVDA